MSRPEAGPAPANRVTVTRRIAAPAHAIFLLVCDPARHVDIDGSGMLRAAPGARPLTAAGQTFDIEMGRRPLGEVPNTKALHQLVTTVPDYLVRCTVTQLIPDRHIEWAVRALGKPPSGHVYGWQTEPLTGGEACHQGAVLTQADQRDGLRPSNAPPPFHLHGADRFLAPSRFAPLIDGPVSRAVAGTGSLV